MGIAEILKSQFMTVGSILRDLPKIKIPVFAEEP
jgi:hypothetical protein